MTTNISAALNVAEGSSQRPLDVDDFKVAATGAATAAKQDVQHTDLLNLLTQLQAIAASTDGLEGFVDGLEALATALNGYVDTLEAKLTPPLLVDSAPGAQFTLADTTFEVTDLPLPDGASTEGTLADFKEANHTDIASLIALLPTALVSGRLKVDATPTSGSTTTVDLAVGVPLAISNGATHAATKYIGVTVSETSNSATAKIRVRDGSGGTILDTITLVANESVSYTYPRGRSVAGGTLYVEVVSGAVEGSVFYV